MKKIFFKNFRFHNFNSPNKLGFTLVEVLVSMAIFLLFAMAIYGGITFVFKIVYNSRVQILETSLISEQLEIIRNMDFADIGILQGVPAGVLPYSQIIERDGIPFTLITTVRNIDDPFDGTAGGTPNDTSPADYKLVEISAICRNGCSQQVPIILNTIVAPKGLEGASDNGHLFIKVFAKDGLGVPQANVHVVNTATNPDTVINDTTDNDGWVKIIDTPTGTLSYHITISKAGFSTDYTIAPTAENTTPTKLPANVTSQAITEVYLSIDELTDLNINTINSNCTAVGNVLLDMQGSKMVGTNPIIYKLEESFITNASGIYNYNNLEWDDYNFSLSSSSYMLAGSIPQLPVVVEPGQTQSVFLIALPKTENSLLVNIKDAGTGLPLSGVEIYLSGTGYESTLTTDLGYVRQTDWSGGAGQSVFGNPDEYFADDGSVDNSSPAGDLKLKKVGANYLPSGYLESSTFDLGQQVDFKNIIWEPLTHDPDIGVEPIKFQIASSNSSTPESWEFVGPDGGEDTFYTSANTLIWSGHNNNQYFRYKVYLSTSDSKKTPTLSEVAFTYTNECTPPGQVFFSDLSAGTYNLEVSKAGYLLVSGEVDILGNTETVVNLSTSI